MLRAYSLHDHAERLAREAGPWKDATEREAAAAALESDDRLARFVFHMRESLSQQAKQGK